MADKENIFGKPIPFRICNPEKECTSCIHLHDEGEKLFCKSCSKENGYPNWEISEDATKCSKCGSISIPLRGQTRCEYCSHLLDKDKIRPRDEVDIENEKMFNEIRKRGWS